ncbi:NAD synthetase [Methanobrevibacter arboriphilus JCM 13429 = DSM 1125]|uniref:NH(3)-dependent NAD(+) synthetase n=1 Tax=Methanobrevibacter arboriphilus JCM 13429 = DSM 1125 TaxID=1300164 RepID=A0A1V6N0Y7_METAZ|nr:NAD+ synthase [Methanobrevibacter arboriphilus]OQD58223.1 NAD synthetase [Methanobrevibacter arboriphilus JCM 13429 = DSM 1125]
MMLPKINSEVVKEEIVNFIREIVNKSSTNGIIIGLSGGIDSTVVAFLSKEAIGKDKIYSYHLYSSTTPKEDTEHARLVSEILGINYKEIYIDTITSEFLDLADLVGSSNLSDLSVLSSSDLTNYNEVSNSFENKSAEGNLKARIRMSMLYYFANMKNCLVAGTGNKSELLIGYFTKYGDGACDFEPIGDIYKTQLRKLAKDWNIPDVIINKPPRAGLWIGQTDEDEIGLTYDVLDQLLYLIVDKNLTNEEILKEMNSSNMEINKVRDKITNNQHKLQFPPSPFEKKKLF